MMTQKGSTKIVNFMTPVFIYSMMEQLIFKYEPFWQEISVESLILRWPLRPLGLLLFKAAKFNSHDVPYVCKDSRKKWLANCVLIVLSILF